MAKMQSLKNQIASDLHRSDLTTQIGLAVTSAINHYGRERFWFLEGRAESTCTSSSTFFAAPTDMVEVDSVLITLSGEKVPLVKMSYTEMDELDSGKTFGDPSYWSYYQDNLRFYPVLNANRLITISYHKKMEEPSASSSNAWTNTAFDLIRFRSEWDIYNHHLRNPEMASTTKSGEMEEYNSLIMESNKKISTGKLRKSGW